MALHVADEIDYNHLNHLNFPKLKTFCFQNALSPLQCS